MSLIGCGEAAVEPLDDEILRSQEGDFDGGWITDDIVGPFKGPPGTLGR